MILGTLVAYEKFKDTHTLVTKAAIPRRDGDLISSSHIVTLKCVVLNKKSEVRQRNKKVWPIQRRPKINRK